MKIHEVDCKLLEFDFGKTGLGRSISRLTPTQLARDASNWLLNKKIPDELDRYGQRRQQEKRQQQQQQQQQQRRRHSSNMDGGFLK